MLVCDASTVALQTALEMRRLVVSLVTWTMLVPHADLKPLPRDLYNKPPTSNSELMIVSPTLYVRIAMDEEQVDIFMHQFRTMMHAYKEASHHGFMMRDNYSVEECEEMADMFNLYRRGWTAGTVDRLFSTVRWCERAQVNA